MFAKIVLNLGREMKGLYSNKSYGTDVSWEHLEVHFPSPSRAFAGTK